MRAFIIDRPIKLGGTYNSPVPWYFEWGIIDPLLESFLLNVLTKVNHLPAVEAVRAERQLV